MLEIIKYAFKRLFRNKSNIIWSLAFPIALGTLFNIAFGSIAQNEAFKAIPVAVVLSDDTYGTALKETLNAMEQADPALFEAQYTSESKANDLLKDREVLGIIKSGETTTLTISSDQENMASEQSILNTFIESYNSQVTLIKDVATTNPMHLEKVISALSKEADFGKQQILQKNDNVDSYTQYFYNLLAMACLFSAGSGVLISCENQGNLSALAARKNVSPTKKSTAILAELIAYTVFQYIINVIGYCYLAFVLKVGVDVEIGRTLLALFAGVFCGISLGYLIGSIGKKDSEFKNGISFAITLPLCFLSGLMIGNIRIVIENALPFVNRINPAALISDCFYTLAIYTEYTRYYTDLISIFILSFIFIGTGIALTRRTQYASL